MGKCAKWRPANQSIKINEAEAKAGFLLEEHTTKPHEKYVLSSVRKRLRYGEVEDIISDMKKSG